MIEEAWNEYRGWAKRARSLQGSSRQWSRAALVCGCLVAIFGAAASQVPDGLLLGKAMAFVAAVLAAVTPVLGREILSVGGEAQWIRARATAEAIKSECLRFAAQLGDYAGSSAKDVFVARRNALTEPAERAGLTPLHDPVPTTGDARRPPIPLTVPWYMENRLGEQIQYYARGQKENEEAVARLRTIGFGSAVIAAILGVAASNFGQERFASWIGVMTTIAATIMAYGLLDRRQYLAATYGAMATRLSRVKEVFSNGTVDVSALVNTTEDLLQGEHAAWTERMTQSIAASRKAAGDETK
jgi:SMODS and SLOG-associating 2TM effector domain 1/Protein of unknown function (DUF4231)